MDKGKIDEQLHLVQLLRDKASARLAAWGKRDLGTRAGWAGANEMDATRTKDKASSGSDLIGALRSARPHSITGPAEEAGSSDEKRR